MRKASIFSFCFLILPLSGSKAQSIQHIEWRQLKEVNKDTIEINGYVFDVYICPPCPEGAHCKPCLPDHITLVENKVEDPQRTPLEGRLRVYTEQPRLFKPGDYYKFTICRKGRQSFEHEAEMVGYKP